MVGGGARAHRRARRRACRIGLTEIPACGTNAEVLAHHGLDAASIADGQRVVERCIRAATRCPIT